MSADVLPQFGSVDPVPLSPIEEGFWRAEESALGSFRVTVLLWLDGRIEAHVLSIALRHLQCRHPKLRAVIAPGNDGRCQYRFDRPAPPIPFEIKDYDGVEPPWREEARRLLGIRFPDDGPLAAVGVLRSRTHARTVLILSVHHAIADGRSGILLVNDLLAQYAALEADPDAAPPPALPTISASRAVPTRWRSRLWLLRRFLRLQGEERRSRQTSLPEVTDVAPQSQWVHWVFSRDKTLTLVRRCRKERTSLGGALVAAACCGLMDSLPASQAVFKCQFPFDVRDRLVGAGAPITAQDLGSFASIMNEFYEVGVRPDFWDLARRSHQSIQAFVQHRGPSAYYNLARLAASPLVARSTPLRASSTSKRVTLLATHYGVIRMRDVYGSLRPRACTLAFKNDLVGPSLFMEGLVMGQELNLGFAADCLEPAFWERLQMAVRGYLDVAASTGGTASRRAPDLADRGEVAASG